MHFYLHAAWRIFITLRRTLYNTHTHTHTRWRFKSLSNTRAFGRELELKRNFQKY